MKLAGVVLSLLGNHEKSSHYNAISGRKPLAVF